MCIVNGLDVALANKFTRVRDVVAYRLDQKLGTADRQQLEIAAIPPRPEGSLPAASGTASSRTPASQMAYSLACRTPRAFPLCSYPR